MKNRRIVICAFILIAAMVVGVGYAALTDQLTIRGDIKYSIDEAEDDFVADVYFSGTPAVSAVNTGNDATGVTAKIENADNGDANDKLNIDVPAGILNVKGDQVIVDTVITNDSTEFNASITLPTDGTVNSTYCSVTVNFVTVNGGSETLSKTATIDANGGTANVRVVITLNETLSELPAGNDSFTVDFDATAVEP